ncbi:MAG TPA: 4-aminobutyrate--2-oxoglutarate transaminase [Elusimicrobiota bacterium]|nr:4-aminobutyrate--2-oxoglutarate transaminase [Elusimicrobiota bacterium]
MSGETMTHSIDLKTSIPGPKSSALMARRKEAVARGPFHATPIFAESAHGALIHDVDGNTLIDLAAGIGVVNVGHTADSVVAAVVEQAGKLLHGSFNTTAYESYVSLCERLNAAAPGAFAKKSFLANSGAEAVENAVKIARAHTGRPAVVCFEHAFHGRTYMAMTLTAKFKPYKTGFAPFCSDVYRAPFPYSYRGVEPRDAFAELVEAIESAGHDQIAAVIVEPVLGEGGFLPAPPEFLRNISEYCAKHGIVVIADEIQSGFGRTGALFASERLGFVPDLILSAKGLGGGLPISAVTGRAEIMDAPVEGGIGGTFGGNPVSAAAALAVMDLFQDGKLLAHSKKIGEQIEKTLLGWKERYAIIGDVRGLGPMMAMEFVKDPKTKEAFPEAAKKLAKRCYEHGVVVLTAGTYGNCIRLLPPLVITDEQLDEAFAVIEQGLKELAS